MADPLIDSILDGKIFIYPTDTLYGIGCNAKDKKAVEKIREIKNRDKKPFSIIAPSMKWIERNFVVDVDLEKYLPGPYTIILKKRRQKFMDWVSNTDTMGIRIPDCPFTTLIEEAGVPFITTSVNLTGSSPINDLEKIPKEIIDKVDFVAEGENLSGKPSALVVDGREIERR